MKLSAPWLDSEASQQVTGMLCTAGFEALFVGGCVRNAIMDQPVNDLDIATSARPEQVMALARQHGHKSLPTGIDHGTVTVIVDGQPFEVTSFRKDIETDGRHAVVAYTDDIAADAQRRDFTMNALYCRGDGTIIDPLDGLPDLLAGQVRFILDPERRIAEDYLRILRFFRFTAWYGRGGIDRDGLAACAQLVSGLSKVARERIGQEFLRLLAAPDPAPAMASMEQAGVLMRCLPGGSSHLLAPLVHIEQQLAIAPDPLRRLAAIGGTDPAASFRLSKSQAKRLRRTQTALAESGPPAQIGYRFGAEIAQDALLIRAASAPAVVRDEGLLFEGLTAADLAQVSFGAHQVCPLAASDLMPEFTGKRLGDALEFACDLWVKSNFTLTRDELLGRIPR